MALSRSSESDNCCVVCFKNVDVYSVGHCDHPVCYECSTRMRVLCKQLECPICRQVIPKAIFTKAVQQYSKLASNLSNFRKDSDYEIYFSEPSLESYFKKLLEHRCKICKKTNRQYDQFSTLSDHLRREHESFFCDLCVEHLRIFTWERRSYSRSELATHRRKGDPDDKSLKGHPLCEFCDRRYFDKDELYRHLRKDHFFCHFCDADGRNDYYGNYHELTGHFKKDHFLCEEGDCKAQDSYTRVFRSDIDLQAHRAQLHTQGMGKAAVRQARTLELEFQLHPRDERGRGRGGPARGGMRREREREESVPAETYESARAERQNQPDVGNREEFPSLAGNSASGGSGGGGQKSLAHKVATRGGMTVRSSNGREEEYPSLGTPSVFVRLSSQDDSNVHIKLKQNYPQLQPPGSSKGPKVKPAPTQPKAMITRVSSTNNIKVQPSGPMENEFPSLASGSSQSFTPQWIQKQKNEPMRSGASVIKVPKNEFPSLPSVSAPIKPIVPKKASSVTIPMQRPKTVIPVENVKKKKQRSPDDDFMDYSLPSDQLGIKIPKYIPNGDLGGSSSNQASKIKMISSLDQMKLTDQRPRYPTKKPEFGTSDFPSLGDSNPVEPDKPFTKKMMEQKKKKVEQKYANAKENQPPNKSNRFSAFLPESADNQQGNSDMMFTSSSGEMFSVGGEESSKNGAAANGTSNGCGLFVQPPNFGGRNNDLRLLVRDLLGGDAGAMKEFQEFSKNYRNGSISAQSYYELIQDLFGSVSFDVLFPELLVLLPDVGKQQELYEAHKKVAGVARFTPCAVCGQILAPIDLKHHKVSHSLDSDFPNLG